MKKIYFIILCMIMLFLVSCQEEDPVDDSYLYFEYENVYGISKDYFILSHSEDELENRIFDIYNMKTYELIQTIYASDRSEKWRSCEIYEDYLIVKEEDSDSMFSIAIYDIQEVTQTPIKRFYTTDRDFFFSQSDHYLIINDHLETIENTHQNIVYFLDLNDLSGWEQESGYPYTINIESNPVGFQLNTKDNMYTFYRESDTIVYAWFKEQEAIFYKSSVESLFENDEEVHLTNYDYLRDSFSFSTDIIIHMAYNEGGLDYDLNVLDLTGQYLDEETITFNKRSGIDASNNWLGNGFDLNFLLAGNQVVLLDKDLNDEDCFRFWISTLEGTVVEIRTDTYLLDTDIIYTGHGEYFQVFDETIFLFARDAQDLRKLVLHKIGFDEGTIYR